MDEEKETQIWSKTIWWTISFAYFIIHTLFLLLCKDVADISRPVVR